MVAMDDHNIVKVKLSRMSPDDIWDAAYRAGLAIRQGAVHQRNFRALVLNEAIANGLLPKLSKCLDSVMMEASYRGYV